jgi:hypothetical protein
MDTYFKNKVIVVKETRSITTKINGRNQRLGFKNIFLKYLVVSTYGDKLVCKIIDTNKNDKEIVTNRIKSICIDDVYEINDSKFKDY